MVTEVKKWGNSIGVRLPKIIAQEAKITEGTSVSIEARDGRIIISRVRGHRYQLADLVRRITPRNRHKAIDTGAPRGKEAW
jgi:antitoxin MazE